MAAGLGTRLRPWTLSHPKALVPVEGVPALERLIIKLRNEGFEEIYVNVHHFGEQIIDFIASHDWGVKITVSDERDCLLDTGGGIAKVAAMMEGDGDSLLVHNVDILSNVNAADLVLRHQTAGGDVTLLTSGRESSRKLVFADNRRLRGWHDLKGGRYRPEAFQPSDSDTEEAFSGIYVLNRTARETIVGYARSRDEGRFPVMDWFLSFPEGLCINGLYQPDLRLLDIGKPESLAQAKDYLS